MSVPCPVPPNPGHFHEVLIMLCRHKKTPKPLASGHLQFTHAWGVIAFSHPDFNGRLRNFTGSIPNSIRDSRAFTAGGELHPAPKANYSMI
jgi:hypothetical protein